jgi:hypothetical protein
VNPATSTRFDAEFAEGKPGGFLDEREAGRDGAAPEYAHLSHLPHTTHVAAGSAVAAHVLAGPAKHNNERLRGVYPGGLDLPRFGVHMDKCSPKRV